MEIASTLINVFVVVAMGTFVTYMTRDRYRELKADIARLETRMDAGFSSVREEFRAVRAEFNGQFSSVRAEFNGQFSSVRAEFNGQFSSVRADITAVALAVEGKAPTTSPEPRQH